MWRGSGFQCRRGQTAGIRCSWFRIGLSWRYLDVAFARATNSYTSSSEYAWNTMPPPYCLLWNLRPPSFRDFFKATSYNEPVEKTAPVPPRSLWVMKARK